MFWFLYYSFFLYFLYLARKYTNAHSLLVMFMIFFLGQRWMTGEDFPGYLLYYIINFKGFDFTFFSLQDLFIRFNLSFSFFIFSLYTLTILFLYKFINNFRYSSLIFVVFIITELSFIILSQLKQSLAIPIFLFSFYFIFFKRYFIGLCFYLLASSVHVATLFLLPFLFLKAPIRKYTLTFILGLICFLPFINITDILPNFLYFKFAHYLDSEYNSSLSIYHYLKYYAIIILFYLLYCNTIPQSQIVMKFLITGFLLYLVLYGLSFQFAPFMRFSYYFRIFEVITFVTFALDSSNKRNFRFLVIPFFTISFFMIAVLDPYNITRYEFKPLSIFESKSKSQLHSEIDDFYND